MESKDKILFLLRNAPKGGVEKVSFDLGLSLKKSGKEVCFTFIEKNGEWIDKFKTDFMIKDLRGPSSLKSFRGLVKYFTAYYNLIKLVKRENITFLISAKEQSNLLAVLCKLFCNINVTVVRHVSILDKQTSDATWVTPILYRYVFCYANSIVAVSEEIANEIKVTVRSKIQKKIHYCPNPVISPELDILAAETIDPPLPNGINICTVGRLSYQKGIDILIKAFSVVIKKNKNLYLHIVGDGELREETNDLVNELNLDNSVIFHGFKSNPYPYLKQCSIFVLPSRFEGLPTVLIEAMYLNDNIIACDCKTGPKEIIKKAGFGELFKYEDSIALSKKISTMILNLETKYSKKELINQYSVIASCDCYIKIIEKLTNR